MLALLRLTGSINVFGRELDVALNPALFAATATADQHHAAPRVAKDAVPEWAGMFRRHDDLWTVDIDPGTGAAPGMRDTDASFTRIIYKLHSELPLRRWWSKQMVGVLGLMPLAGERIGIVAPPAGSGSIHGGAPSSLDRL